MKKETTTIYILLLSIQLVHAQYCIDPKKGSDQNIGNIAHPFKTIEKARETIRSVNFSMAQDIVVYLRSGTYPIKSTLAFTEKDGGTNGFKVIYQAFPGEKPVLEAGQKVTGWKRVGSNIWKAPVAIDNFRQLYVNGQRAQRARSEAMYSGTGWPRPYTSFTNENWKLEKQFYPDGIKVSKNAITTAWQNQSDIELVWIGEQSKITWRSHRLLVNALVDSKDDSTVIKLDNYGYPLTSAEASRPLPENPFYIENAFELLDKPGEWYFNRSSQELFYFPREGEKINDIEVWIPGNVTTILSIKGTSLASKVSNITFEGVTFSHTTWLRPSNSRLGACTNQVDKYIKDHGAIGRAHKAINRKESFFDPAFDYVIDNEGEAEGFKPNATVELNACEKIRIVNCRFLHLGAVAIDLTQGCNDVAIEQNVFKDLSATAIVIGRWDQDFIGSGEEVCKDTRIANNLIEKIGQEYYNSPGITAFHTDGMVITHNEINDVPYSGISSGWGSWGGKTSWTTSNRRNVIEHNLIKNFGQLCSDGGGIYTVGIGKSRTDNDTVTSKIRYNFISQIGTSYGALYPDQGSCYYEFLGNVCEEVETNSAGKWLHLWSASHHDIRIDGNFSNSNKFLNKGINCPLTNHTLYEGKNRPKEALDIINNAGIQPALKQAMLADDLTFKSKLKSERIKTK